MEEGIFKRVQSLQFGVFSPQQIKEMGVAKVVTPELYDREGYPVDGGLMDVRLGVIDPGLSCKTCGLKLKDCLGHFGYAELARPVIHISFVTVVLDLLRSTCWDCGEILIPKEKIASLNDELDKIDKKYGAEERRNKVKEIIRGSRTITKCPHCNAKQKKIKLEKPSTFVEDETRLSPIEVRTRLEKIPNESLSVFGIHSDYVRPEWMVLTVLPIPPVTVRPSITLESGERSEDDLTHKLGDIIRINQRLFENINAGAPEIIVEDLWDLLQYHVTTFFNNEVSQLPPARHRSGQPLKTLTERIKSKEGRIRHNLAGKRVNFSARTVISPDPKLEINEVGVPMIIATKLTVPEKVTEWNMKYLKEFVERGPSEYPGSNYVVRPDGRRKRITDETKEALLEEIQPGYVVERHLMDGDISLFNRQPSLHRMNMMCHRVRVLPGKTLRLNPAVCHPYNADFDGDEMNLHIPQTEEARSEAETLMEVQTQIISPRYGLSVIGCNQDSVTGNYILTKEGFSITRDEAIDMLSKIGIDDFSRLPKKAKVTGKEIFSVVLPEDFNFIGTSRVKNTDPKDPDGDVVIKNGKLVSGVMDKNNLGEGSGLLLRNLHKKYGQKEMVTILGRIYRLGVEVLTHQGFTVGLMDTDVNEVGKKKISSVLSTASKKADALIKDYHDGSLELIPGMTLDQTFEARMMELLNKARNETGNIVSEVVNQESSQMIMLKSGGRGTMINLAQMAAVVGQQSIGGGRVNKGYTNRTLSCFEENDLTETSRGFIKNGFKSGLTPYELFFMAMTGRESLMDTALRTPKSGYLYRRLSNALQDLKVEYDYTVRDSAGKIVQFNYGEDGVDVSKSEGGIINVKKIIERVKNGN